MRCLRVKNIAGLSKLGLGVNQLWYDDPKHLVFLLSRYKFVAKMLNGSNHVLEIGCGDAFGTRIVQQHVKHVTAIDFDPIFVRDARSRIVKKWPISIKRHDILKKPVVGSFDGVYALDVLEHISKKEEQTFILNAARSLKKNGMMIIGTPSLESQVFASAISKAGHVNCQDRDSLHALLQRFFRKVFVFSMNDEVVHTGFYPMAHYLLAIGCGKRVSVL